MFFRDISFKVKIFIIIFISIFLPSIVVSVIMYNRSEKAIEDQTSRVVISSIQLSISNIDSALNSVIGMGDLMEVMSFGCGSLLYKNLVKHDRSPVSMRMLGFFFL